MLHQQATEELDLVRSVRARQRSRYLRWAAVGLFWSVGAVVVLCVEHGYLPQPRATVWTGFGDAALSLLPYAIETFAIVGALGAIICVYLAFAPWVTRRRLRRLAPNSSFKPTPLRSSS